VETELSDGSVCEVTHFDFKWSTRVRVCRQE
jgi:hypothetical protein